MSTRQGLAARLHGETRQLHAQAERAGIMPALLGGTLGRSGYCGLLRNLYELYAELEPAMEAHAAHPCIAPIHFAELRRQAALAQDLEHLHGGNWAGDLLLQPAAAEYAQRLRQLAHDSPERLAAHAYVRYLGDLNGGRILRRIVAQSLCLEAGDGTRFYDYAGLDLAAMSVRYRQGLNAIEAPAETVEAIVAEAQHAFALHKRLFQELQQAQSPEV